MLKTLIGSKKLTFTQIAILSALVIAWLVTLVMPALTQPKAPKVYYQTQGTLPKVKADTRAKLLRAYLAKHNSPLTDNADDFVKAADQNGVDWRLVAAISGVESTFGKNIPGGYNGWGWGVYGDHRIYFNSWKDAIDTITLALKTDYIDKGYTEPFAINRKYAASKTWGTHVTFFMNDIQAYADANQIDEPIVTIRPDFEISTAGQSGALASMSRSVASAN